MPFIGSHERLARFRSARDVRFVPVVAVLLATAPALGADLPSCAGPAFGTTYRVTLARELPGHPLATVHREVEAVVARIDRAASTWRDDSDVSLFNRAPAGTWVEVSEDLVALVGVARRIHEASGGAFDVTATADGAASPGMAAIESRPAPPALCKTRTGVALDVGGIGPGYAVDRIGHRLVELGSSDHLVELGGEVRAWGTRPDGAAWRVRVGGGSHTVELAAGTALATSTARPGRSPVDPRTGRVVACRSNSATVRHLSCAEADAWAVAALVLGLDAGPDGVIDPPAAAAEQPHDVVIYGATSGGITAAIQAKAMGRSVIIVEPGRHVGGLSAGGLGATDIGNKRAIGGLSREFYRRIGHHYAAPAAWPRERREDYLKGRTVVDEREMWTFEPHVAGKVFKEWLAEAGVEVVLGGRLDLGPGGVEKDGRRIVAFRTEDGRRFAGLMFIDATYEGDLMAKAGVSYHVGREAESVYGETLNGIRAAQATKHQFTHDVDPWIVPGDPASGLVPLVSPDPPGTDGDGDHRVQAYNFRMCTTDVPENRRDWPRPEGYDAKEYELLLRTFEAGDHRVPWNPVWMPNRKTDTNNNFAVSTDFIGANYAYPEAGHAERERIVADHRRYQQGLMWTLANHPRVPEKVRAPFQRLGLAKDEFVDNDNWPHQLYVREARRMVSDYVMTQADCQWRRAAEDPVGLGAYNMDSHNCQRYVTATGVVRNEGDIQVGVKPYRISFRSIRPRREECENLLVPVCLAASHIAYGSIRMEPVFMVLGQSAATAAVLAIDGGTAVQDVDHAALRERLLADGQVLEWVDRAGEGSPRAGGHHPGERPGLQPHEQAHERRQRQ